MRIAITGQTYYPGNNGQAIFTIHLAEGLARAGHEVHVIVPNDAILYETGVIHGVHVHRLASLGFRKLHPEAFLTPFPAGRVLHIFKQYPPDVLHIQDHYFLSRAVALLALQQGIPVMGTNHFLPENVLHYLNPLPLPSQTKISILWNLMLWTYNRLCMVTTPTETAARILRKQNIRVPVQAVSCGVDTVVFRPDPAVDRAVERARFGLNPDQSVFLYVGRLDREKRVDVLLEGLAVLKTQGRKDIQLAIAGQGAAARELHDIARRLGLNGDARFLGYVPAEDLPALYRAADIFIMPSPEELQSIATLEAMASGRPVLAADARALPELVSIGHNGTLFQSGSVEDAARHMAELTAQKDVWEQMGRASRERAVAHSLENTVRRYEDLYRRLVCIQPRVVGLRRKLLRMGSDTF